MSNPRLSVCIATFMRGRFIAETLASLVPQLDARCELVIVDGASPDDTEQVVRRFADLNPRVRYIREAINSGVDEDYDKTVSYARGDYCWLMTDDDLLVDGALKKVLAALDDEPELIVVNSRVHTADLQTELKPSSLPVDGESIFGAGDIERFFEISGAYLSFIGCVVVRRSLWLSRSRGPYLGSLFVHVGVIFQLPSITSAVIVREPLLTIRYGNAMWTPRGFEIWLFKWPNLIWSFEHLSAATRAVICNPKPYLSVRRLLWYRALGGYSQKEFASFLRPRLSGIGSLLARLVARLPKLLANTAAAIYFRLKSADSSALAIYELSRSKHATGITRYLARSNQR